MPTLTLESPILLDFTHSGREGQVKNIEKQQEAKNKSTIEENNSR